MPTIKDVAKKAGVGIATVSRVMNNKGYVKLETRERVLEVVKELEYHPNEIARQLLKKKNQLVAFVLPNNKHLFFSELLFELEQVLFEDDYKLMVCNSGQEIERELALIDMLKKNRVDSLVLLTNNDIEHLISPDLSIVSFDRIFKDIPFVSSDNYGGGALAAELLFNKGCSKFMFIGDDSQVEDVFIKTEVTKRKDGFIDKLETLGIKRENILDYRFKFDDYNVPKDYIEDILHKHRDVDGIFTISDACAFTVIQTIEKMGVKVPEDVKVIGFDGGRSFLNFGKKITSIAQSPKEIAKAFRDIIIEMNSKEKTSNRIVPIYYSKGETI